ncbi:MAG: ABC transporter substrate-binding protein [Actinomycetota bacterium]
MSRSRRAALAALAAAALSVPVTAGAAPGGFPVTLDTPAGDVTIPRAPQRIVSLSPTATETLYAIGAGPQVIAVDKYSDHPARAPRTDLSGFSPNVEAIAARRPDLVVVSHDVKGVVGALRTLRIPVLFLPAARNVATAYRQWRRLGRATGHDREAGRLVARVRGRIDAIVAATPRRTHRPTVYHEVSPDLYSATSRTFIGEAYRRLGLVNLADAAPGGRDYPQLSPELIVSRDPDLIVLADADCCDQTPATVAARPAWGALTAVREGHVVTVDEDVASRWGPRIATLYRDLARGVAALPR